MMLVDIIRRSIVISIKNDLNIEWERYCSRSHAPEVVVQRNTDELFYLRPKNPPFRVLNLTK